MPVAGDVHNKRPVVGVHEDAGGLRTGGVECRGAAAVGALHAAAVHLPLHPLPAVHTLLHGGQEHDNRGQRGKCMWKGKRGEEALTEDGERENEVGLSERANEK